MMTATFLKWTFLVCIILVLTETLRAQDTGPFEASESTPIIASLSKTGQDTSRAQLLLKLSNHYIRRKVRRPVDVDSSLYYARQAGALSKKLGYHKGTAFSYLLMSWLYPLVNQSDKGKYYAQNAVQVAKANRFHALLGESYFALSGYYSLSDMDLKKRIKLSELSLQAFRDANMKEKEAHLLRELGDLYMIQTDYGQSLEMLKHAQKIYQSVNYPKMMGVYDLLGRIYSKLGDSKEGIRYGLMALQNAKAMGDTSLQTCTFHNRVGLTYRDMKEYDNAYHHFRISLRIAIVYNDTASIHQVAANAASILNMLDRPKDAILLLDQTLQKYPLVKNRERLYIAPVYIISLKKLQRYEDAKQYCNELLAIVTRSEPDDDMISKIYATIIPFYLDAGDTYSAEKYIPLHKQLSFRAKNKLHESENFLWQSRLDSARGNYIASMRNYQHYTLLKDSIFNATKIKQLSQIELIYDIERKDENIGILTKQSQLQNSMLEQASRIQTITFFSIILLLGIIALLYHSFITSKKNSKALESKQNEIHSKNISLGRLLTEKDWLVKEIHHRVKNNLHMIVGLLESQSEYLKGDEAKIALAESEHRVQSMSMIHQMLYQTDNFSSIEISPYIYELVQYLKDSFENKCPVTFNLDIDRLEMNISHSVPLGLILNEAIVNSLKYAFPDCSAGTIHVIFKQIQPRHFVLTISDNGVGLSPDFNIQEVNSFGLTLIKGLCEELDGKLEVTGTCGTTVQVSFEYTPEEKYVEQYSHI